MKIALLGYGKMGREIETVALTAGHSIVGRFHLDDRATMESLRGSGAEVAIDFSQPDAVESNVLLSSKAKIPLVIGTTGWEASLNTVQRLVDESGIGCIIGSNFSVGVNLLLEIVRSASKLISAAGYDAYITEAHHRTKKDFPSGTALRLSEAVLSGMKSKTRVASELQHGEVVPVDTLMISSIRAGAITGTHTVGYESLEDSITITHTAKNRQGFAGGAVRAAEWIVGRQGFYRFEEMISEILEN